MEKSPPSVPDWTPGVRARLSSLRLAPTREAEIVEELSQHLDDRWRELVAGGTAPATATRLTLAEFRDADLLARYMAPLRQSRCVEAASPGTRRFLLGGLMTDLRQAIRELRAAPGFTVVALVVLTLGIGATTAIFSVVDAVALRALPFDEHDRLVAVGERRPPGPRDTSYDPHALMSIATPNYLDWVAEQQVFESIAGVVGAPFSSFTLKEPGTEPEDVPGLRVTAGFFDVLRIRPALGRAFTSDNEIDGRHRVVVLSDGLWRRRFGGNPDIVGRRIAFDDGAYEVVGIMPPDVSWDVAYTGGAVRPTEILVPYVIPAGERVRAPDGGRVMIIKSIARLKPGVSIEQAQAQMDQIAAALEKAHPAWNKDNKAGVRPLRDHLVGTTTKSWMLMLLGAVGIVLLIACANVANLLLARASAREREVAVRAALGAGRLRLMRQLMIESLVLSVVGTALATALAWWAIHVLRTSMPEGVPRVAAIALDLRVFAAAAGLSVLTALALWGRSGVAGVTSRSHQCLEGWDTRRQRRSRASAPPQRAGRRRGCARGRAPRRRRPLHWQRHRADANRSRVQPRTGPYCAGFAADGARGRPSDAVAALGEIVERVSQAPGVIHASLIYGGLPLGRGNWSTDIKIPGRELGRVTTSSTHESSRRTITKRWGFRSAAAGCSRRPIEWASSRS